MKSIYVVGTADTKGAELAYLAGVIQAAGGHALVADVGLRGPGIDVDISARHIASCHPEGAEWLLALQDRGEAVAAMGEAFENYICSRGDLAGVVGIGGGGGTSIVTRGMRALPLGLPKIMVSTLASGDVSAYVDVSDIVMMPSVTDFAGLNRLSRVILHNAAYAVVGMARSPASDGAGRPALGLTMFGVTTPCVMAISEAMRDDYDCMVFHATGTGGRSMEKLVDSGIMHGVIDITTTEVCDLLIGGVLPATEDRFGAIARTGLPYVGSAGALDMVNFWAPETIPARFGGRNFYRHNPNVTLMRTTAEESVQIGRWIAAKLNACTGPVRFLIPEKGVSALDIEGGAFFDPEADAALFAAFEKTFEPTPHRRIERIPLHVNDPAFAAAAVAAFRQIASN